MSRIAALTRNPVMIALVAMLAIAGCASKKTPNSAADLGLSGAGAATPGSAQDFTVNIGDRIFFDTDSSSIRAAATRDFLVSKGVSANRLKTISYGKERPVAVCDDISCWSQNRRAVTTLSGAGS